MRRFNAVLFVTCLGMALSGCDRGEQGQWLENRLRRLEVELAEKMEVAQNLEERRLELDVLEKELAELKAGLNRPSAEELSRRLVAGPGLDTVSVQEEQGVLAIRLGGTGGASMLMEVLRALAPSERALVLKRVVVEHRRWAAELEAPAEPKSSPKEKPSKPKPAVSTRPMPQAGLMERLFDGDDLARRQHQIAQTERRLAELDRVLGEARTYAGRLRELKAQVLALHALNPGERLVGQRAVVEALFGGGKPRLRLGVAEFQGPRLTLTGLEKGEAAKRRASLAEVAPVLQSDADTVVLSTAGQP